MNQTVRDRNNGCQFATKTTRKSVVTIHSPQLAADLRRRNDSVSPWAPSLRYDKEDSDSTATDMIGQIEKENDATIARSTNNSEKSEVSDEDRKMTLQSTLGKL